MVSNKDIYNIEKQSQSSMMRLFQFQMVKMIASKDPSNTVVSERTS